jgi:ferrochelatase
MAQKTAVLLVNVGTPDSPKVKDVRRYLSQFLNDPRVIDLPWLLRKFLVNAIIVPFRAKKSSGLYQKLWTENGSPLLYYGQKLETQLQQLLGQDYKVFFAMRYCNPPLKKALEEIRQSGFSKLVVVPLFPQYASSTTGTINEAVMNAVKSWNVFPEIQFISQFYNHPGFIDAFARKIGSYHPETFDHIIFSYHGLPLRHINKVHPHINYGECTCSEQFPAHGQFCYKACCYETTRLIAARLGLKKENYSQGFQSRLSNNWLQPFTDELIRQKAQQGIKRILIVAPAFVADCLETTIELGVEYKNLFIKAGGIQLEYVESLNDMPEWGLVLKEMIEK